MQFFSDTQVEHLQMGTFNGANPLGVTRTVDPKWNDLGLITTNLTIQWPYERSKPGRYMVILTWVGTGAVAWDFPSFTASAGVTQDLAWVGNTANAVTAPQDTLAGVTKGSGTFIINTAGATAAVPATLTFATDGVFPGTQLGGDIWVIGIRDPST